MGQYPQLYCVAWQHVIPMASLCQVSWFCPLPASHALSPLERWTVREGENWNVLCSVQHCSATTKTSVCYQHCFLMLEPKYSIIPDTTKKMTSVQAETRTVPCYASGTALPGNQGEELSCSVLMWPHLELVCASQHKKEVHLLVVTATARCCM